jgi:hypothetical protein
MPPGLNSLGEAAKSTFLALARSVCGIELYPEAIPVEEAAHDESVRSTNRLEQVRLTRDFFVLRFSPEHLPATYLQNRPVRLRRSETYTVHFSAGGSGPGDLPSTPVCAPPAAVRVVASAFGYIGDTGLFPWNVNAREIVSPVVTFTPISVDGRTSASQRHEK